MQMILACIGEIVSVRCERIIGNKMNMMIRVMEKFSALLILKLAM